MTIGATRGMLMRDVVAGAARLVVPGTIVGLLVAAVMAQAAVKAFPAVDAQSPIAYVAIAVVQLAVTLGASLGPARRAANVDPSTSLRAE